MIPLAIPQMTGREAAYLLDCVASNFVSSVGPYVDRFEGMVAQAACCANAVATSSGTTGLHAALLAVGVGRDDLVILPSFTFIASANAVAHCGAKPWLFDVSAESWTLDYKMVARALAEDTKLEGTTRIHRHTGQRIAAMLPVFTLGMPADMDPIMACARDFGLPVVVDAAAALGSRYKGRSPGELGADLTVFSFNGNKTVTAGGGGVVAGNDADLIRLVKHLTTTARVGNDYTHDRVGFNYRMTNLQAAVGCAQMESLDEFVAAKRRIADRYNRELINVEGFAAFPQPVWSESACWFSGVLVEPGILGPVDGLIKKLKDGGIDSRPFWKPIHHQVPYSEAPCEDMAVTDSIWHRVLTLPCSTGLLQEEHTAVINLLRDIASAAGDQ
jgi:perosamine synthetase